MKRRFRKVVFYKDYFERFFITLPLDVRDKFIWTFNIIEEFERVPSKYLKYIKNGVYEIRVASKGNAYRVFAFFSKGKLVVTINGFQKKTNKTPSSEIKLALKIKDDYEKKNK